MDVKACIKRFSYKIGANAPKHRRLKQMKKCSCVIALLIIAIVSTLSLSYAEDTDTTGSTYTYTGGIEGRVNGIMDPPFLTGPAKLTWDPKKREGDFLLDMAGGVARCTVSSSDGINIEGNFSCVFTGLQAEGPVKIILSTPDQAGIPQTFKGSFDITILEQNSAIYTGTFKGAYRDW